MRFVKSFGLALIRQFQYQRPDGHGQMRPYRYPLSGKTVVVTRFDGIRRVSLIDSSGYATVRLDPGRYVVAGPDFCYLAKITLVADESKALTLNCAAP